MSKKTKRSESLAEPKSPASEPAEKSSFLLIAAGLGLATLLFFWRATGFGFVFPGEASQLLANPDITGSAGFAAAFSLSQPWQPLAWLSHMLDFAMFGDKPEAQRAVNLLLHAANVVLLFALFRRWLGQTGGAWLALLFALHPLRVEPVIWLVERRMLLATLFVLLALRAHLQRTAVARGLVFLCGLLAALSHPAGAVLPVLLLLMDVWPLERSEAFGTRVLEKAELWAVSLGTLLISAQAAVPADALWTNGAIERGARLLHAASGMGMALVRTVFPFPLTILTALEPPVWAAAVLVLVCGAVVWQGSAAVRAGLGWFVVAMLPTLGLLQPELSPWSESGTYLAHVGLLAALVWLLGQWGKEKLLAVAFTAALVWTGLGWIRVSEWSSSDTLLQAAIARGGHPLAHYQLGQLMLQRQRGPEAEREFRQVLQARPRHVDAQLQLGAALLLQRRNAEAMGAYQEAARLGPERADTLFALGLVEASAGQTQQGVEHLKQAQARGGLNKEQEAQAENAIGVYLMGQQKFAEAEPHLKRSWTLVPTYASAHRNYALTLDRLGQSRRAYTHLEKRARLFTKDAPEVVEVWTMLVNKLAGEEKKKIEDEKRAAEKK